MCNRSILIVLRETGAHREITEFDDAQDAERFIERLLEGGAERESIRVLAGQALAYEVHQKPIVSLITARSESQSYPAVDDETTEPVGASAVSHEVGYSELPARTDLLPVAASAESRPYTRDGIRFSTLFKHAY